MNSIVIFTVLYCLTRSGDVEGGLVPPGMKNTQAPLYAELAKMSRCQLSTFWNDMYVNAAINDAQCRSEPAESINF